MTKRYNHYIGKAGQLFVMSEFLIRGWNVSIPEVDVGDDIFVVEDEKGLLNRVQVKTSKCRENRKGYSGSFQVPLKQLKNLRDIPVHYFFIIRDRKGWGKPIIVLQDVLLDYYEQRKIGSVHLDKLNLYFSYYNDTVKCSGLDFSSHISDYRNFPIITH